MIAAIIQARISSNRLPGKIMMETCGKTMLEHMILRIKQSKKLDEIIVATSINKLDNIIEEWCKKNNIKCFRGPENDVLKRYKLAKDFFNVDIVVRIGADSPLMDPKIIDDVVELFESNNYDYVTNLFPVSGRTFPDGVNVEVFSSETLDEVDKNAKKPSDREHVTFYLWMQPERFKIFRYDYPEDLSKFRFNLDYIEDYCLIRSIFESLYPKNNFFTLEDTISWLKQNPKILEFNNMIESNLGWQKSFDEDAKMTN